MTNNQKAEYIFQQLVERGAALPHTAVLCIETALNDLDIEAAQHNVQRIGGTSQEVSAVCSKCGNETTFTIEFPASR